MFAQVQIQGDWIPACAGTTGFHQRHCIPCPAGDTFPSPAGGMKG